MDATELNKIDLKKFAHLPTDTLITIALNLELPEILFFCKQEDRIDAKICKNDTFWMNLFYKKFPNLVPLLRLYRNPNRTWRDLYLRLRYSLDQYNRSMHKFDKADEPVRDLARGGYGDLDLLRFFIHAINASWNSIASSAMEGAIDANDLLLAKEIIRKSSNYNEYHLRRSLDYARRVGKINMVNYFRELLGERLPAAVAPG